MRVKIKWKAVAVLMLLCLAVGAGWFLLHRYQMRGMYGAFLEQADRAEEKGRMDRTARFLRQYLLLKPDDVRVRERYGLLREKLARSKGDRMEALAVFEQVLAREPQNQDLRRRAVKLCMQLGGIDQAQIDRTRIDQALEHLEVLRKNASEEAEVCLLIGRCEEAKNEEARAEQSYRAAIKKDKHSVEAYVRLANMLSGSRKNPEKAREMAAKVMDDLVSANPESMKAYLSRAVFRQTRESPDLAGAEADLVIARKLAPDDLEALMASAGQRIVEFSSGDKSKAAESPALAEARQYLNHALEMHPGVARVYNQLAGVEILAQKPKAAIEVLRSGLEKVKGRDRNNLLWDLAILLIENKDADGAKDAIEQMRKLGKPAHELDFLRAQLLAHKGDWREAAARLEETRPLLAGKPKLVVQADLLLAECFKQMGDVERQLGVLRRAQEADPLSVGPRLGVTLSLLAMGHVNEAIEQCEKLVKIPQAPPGASLLLARMLILRNLSQPRDERNWDQVEKFLEAAAKANPKVNEILILRAEVMLAKGETKEARNLIENAKADSPTDAELWIALAHIEGRSDQSGEAMRILREAEKAIGPVPEIRVAKLRYVPANNEEALEFLSSMAKDLHKLDNKSKAQLLSGLAQAYARINELSEAEKLWSELISLEPKRLQAHLQLFDLYLQEGNEAGMKETLEAIRKVEGVNGPLGHFGEASILIRRARNDGETDLTEKARSHLRAASTTRPGWSRIALSLAAIAEIEGNHDLMIDHLRQAVLQGERQPHVVRRLADLLRERNQGAEALVIIRQLQEAAPISGGLQKLAAEISLSNHMARQAFEFAESAVDANSKDPDDHRWHGEVLLALGKLKEAEGAFRKAVAVGGDAPAPWVELVQFYVFTKDVKKAQAVVEEASTNVSSEKRAYLLAQCYEALGDSTQAEKLYVQAQAERPKDLQVSEGMARFYLNLGQTEKAKPLLEKMLVPELTSKDQLQIWVRRNLAMALGFWGNDDRQRDALKLVDANLKLFPKSIEDQVAKGVLLAKRPKTRREAINMLEGAFKIRQPTPDQEFLMANLYEAEGDWGKARTQMLHLVTQPGNNERRAEFVASFVAKLIDRDEMGAAKEWLSQLQELRPKDIVTVDCTMRYYGRSGNAGKALEAIRSYVTEKDVKPDDAIARLGTATDLLVRLSGLYPEVKVEYLKKAEEYVKTYIEKSGKAEGRLVLANVLAGVQKLDDALDQCEQALKTLAPERVLPVAVSAVAMNAAVPAQVERVESWITAAKRAKPNIIQLDLSLASLREQQGRYPDAETLYVGVLKRQPDNIIALNNLAFLLGLRGRAKESLPLIEKAIEEAGGKGPIGSLIDSRGAILLALGKLDQAQIDLEAALKLQRTESRLFHMAQLHLAARKTKEALETRDEAIRVGLRAEMLHPLERPAFEKLCKLRNQP